MKVSAKQLGKGFAKLLSSTHNEADREKLIGNLAKLIVSEQKISKLGTIKQSFNKYWDEVSGEIEIEVETPDGTLPHLPKEIAGQKIAAKSKTNKNLIAGAIIKIGDYEVDNSLRSKVRKLSQLSN